MAAQTATEFKMPPVPTVMERMAATPEPWNPNDPKANVPNPIVLRLLDRTEAMSIYGAYPLFEAVDGDGNFWALHAFHYAIRQHLEGLPMMSVVGIHRQGKVGIHRQGKETAKGQSVWRYRIITIYRPDRVEDAPKSEPGVEEPF